MDRHGSDTVQGTILVKKEKEDYPDVLLEHFVHVKLQFCELM